MKSICLSILIVLFISLNISHAQVTTRLEIPSDNLESFTIPCGNKGVLVLTQLNKQEFNIRSFSKDLEQIWSKNGTIENGLDFVTHSYDGEYVSLLFSRFKSNSYLVFKIQVASGKMEKFQIYSVGRMEISNFKVLNHSIFIAGIVDSQPLILFTNLKAKQTKILPSVVKGQAEIQTMDLDTAQQQINVTYTVGNRAKNYQLVIKSFDEDGNIIGQVLMNPSDEYAIMNAKLNQINDSLQVVVGTYGHKNTIGSSRGPSSQGLYFNSFMDGEIINSKFYSFTKFNNFFNFLSVKQKERQEKKIKDKEEKGEDLRLDYRLLMHEIIKNGENYIVVAEAFYPDYRSSNFYPYGGNMGAFSPLNSGFFSPWSSLYNPYRWGYGNYGLYSPFSNYYSPWGYRGYNYYGNQQQFDGWIYTHAIIAEFDKNGNMLWDHCVDLNDIKEEKLTQKIKTSVNQERVILSYAKDNKIISKTISEKGSIENEQSQDIETENEGDKIRRSSKNDLNFWYDNYFLAHGYQSINNDQEGKRSVYYLNKILLKP
jgi:hypothetical protein